jgi:hypothetical protein
MVTENTGTEGHLMKFLENQHHNTKNGAQQEKRRLSNPNRLTEEPGAEKHLIKVVEKEHRNTSNGAEGENTSVSPPFSFKDQGKTAESFSHRSSAPRKHVTEQLEQTMAMIVKVMNAVSNQYRNAMKRETQKNVVGILISGKRKAERAATNRRDKNRVHFRLLKKIESQIFQVKRAAQHPANDDIAPCLSACLPASLLRSRLPFCLPPSLPPSLAIILIANSPAPPCAHFMHPAFAADVENSDALACVHVGAHGLGIVCLSVSGR